MYGKHILKEKKELGIEGDSFRESSFPGFIEYH